MRLDIEKLEAEAREEKTKIDYAFVGNSYVAISRIPDTIGQKELQEQEAQKDVQIRHLESRVQTLSEDNDELRKDNHLEKRHN